MLSGVCLVKDSGSVRMEFRRDFSMSLVCTDEKRQLLGGKLCYTILSDGTVTTSHYDKKGAWKFTEPTLINEVFNLTEPDRKLWHNSVYANGQKVCILEKTITELDGEFNLLQKMEEFKDSIELEIYISFTGEEGDDDES